MGNLLQKMATTKAVIRRNRVNEKGITPIYIRYTHNQRSILFAVGQMINPDHWDDIGFVKKSMRGYTNINALIEKKKRAIDDLRINLQLTDVEPTIENIKEAFNKKHSKGVFAVKMSPYFLDYWDKFVEFQVNITKISSGTVRQYRAAKSRLYHFEKVNKVRLTFQNIDQSFYESYLYYLYSVRSCSPSTVGGQIKSIKAYTNWCFTNQKIPVNMAYKEFTKPKNPTQIFTLTHEQLDKLFLLDLSLDARLQIVRDMFCLCCSTGLRYSDAVRLERANIKDDHIIINTKKTNDTAIIPLNDYSRTILNRYPDKLPRMSNQRMNDYLKVLGRLAELDEEHEVITYKAGVKEVHKKPLYELLTTHMARRTFITQSLERGMLPSTVMKLSTHKDVKSFNLYINTTKARLKQEVDQAWNTLSKD